MLLPYIALAAIAASTPNIKQICQPCRAKTVLATIVVKDRADGRERFVLTNTNEDSGVELIFLDYEKNEGKAYTAPAGAGAWAMMEVPGDRLIVGTYYDGAIMVFDLKKMEFIKTVKIPGASYIWNFAMGKDGRVYMGVYNTGKLIAFDLNTYEIEDCGAPAPPNLYLRYVFALPDGRILCYFVTEKPTTLIYDPSTKKFEPAPEELKNTQSGVSWQGRFLTGSNVFDGKTLESVQPFFPTPPADKGVWRVIYTKGDTLYLRQGNAIYSYKPGDKELKLISNIDMRNAGICGVTSKSELLGLRGQDYFIIKKGDKGLHLRQNPAESGPRPMLFLRVDDHGRIWGGPHFGQTIFWVDPKTKKYTNTGCVCDAGGEVYDVVFYKDKTYAMAYSGGDIVEYDPAKPWDQWNHKNPKVIHSVGPNYIRPANGAVVTLEGKLYCGWMARYGVYGGAISITDLDTGNTELIENPLGEQAIGGLAVADGKIFVGTSLGANGLSCKKGEWSKIGIIDIATKKVLFEQPFQGAYTIRVLTYDNKTKRMALSIDGKIHLFDTEKKQYLEDLTANIPPLAGASVGVTNKDILYYGSGEFVMSLDIQTGKTKQLAEAPKDISNVAIGPKGQIYFTAGADLYEITGG